MASLLHLSDMDINKHVASQFITTGTVPSRRHQLDWSRLLGEGEYSLLGLSGRPSVGAQRASSSLILIIERRLERETWDGGR
ncbi:hypothetical protein BT69DRAFT_1283558 [Atractiella rhizophila]|nr:hypothetical protein BT69DRAFT_1283558 [Atractiella rhizophila]